MNARSANEVGANAAVADEVAGALEAIRRRSVGLMGFVERYRTVAELPAPRRQPVRMEQFLSGIDRLLSATLREKGIEYRTVLTPSNLSVDADPQLLEQAVINLLRNAADAVVAVTREAGSRRRGSRSLASGARAGGAFCGRQRCGYSGGSARSDLRAVLHDQARGLGHRTESRAPRGAGARRATRCAGESAARIGVHDDDSSRGEFVMRAMVGLMVLMGAVVAGCATSGSGDQGA